MGPAFRKVMTVGAVPAVDVVEKDDTYEVMADVPGFDEKNIEIKLVDGTLCIKGERKSEKEEK
jgi:HSP20 family protein